MDVCAVPLHSCWKTFRPGQIISFDDKFRTKNVPGLDEYNPNKFSLTGDLRYDPHVYIKSDNEKFVLTLDPKWLATTTSFVNFKMGWIDITGLAVVKSVDPEKIVATPYIIGTPKNELWDMLFGVGSS